MAERDRKQQIVAALRGRLRRSADAEQLAVAWLDGAQEHAWSRTCGVGPVASSLGAERAELMMHVSRRLGRLIEVEEISALLRVPTVTARSAHKLMVATYTDDAGPLEFAWALEGAYADSRGTYGPVKNGHRVIVATDEKLDTLLAALERREIAAVRKTDEPAKPRLVVIDRSFPLDRYELPDWSSR